MEILINNKKNAIVIELPKSILINAFNLNPDNSGAFKIVNKSLFFEELVERLKNDVFGLNDSNATESGLTSLEYFLDEAMGSLIEDGSEAIEEIK